MRQSQPRDHYWSRRADTQSTGQGTRRATTGNPTPVGSFNITQLGKKAIGRKRYQLRVSRFQQLIYLTKAAAERHHQPEWKDSVLGFAGTVLKPSECTYLGVTPSSGPMSSNESRQSQGRATFRNATRRWPSVPCYVLK